MVNQRLIGAAVLVGVFALGATAGGGGAYAWLRRDEAASDEGRAGMRDPRRVRALERQLDLTPTQREQVRAIFERSGPQRRALMEQMNDRCGAELRAHHDLVTAEIRAVLTPEQQPRFDAIVARQHDRFPFGFGPPGHGPRGRRPGF